MDEEEKTSINDFMKLNPNKRDLGLLHTGVVVGLSLIKENIDDLITKFTDEDIFKKIFKIFKTDDFASEFKNYLKDKHEKTKETKK